ncbi:hypothetical protein KEF29_34715 [Streptomyces tuirus]|uniref:Lipoprotein n=1 Tax=Streptomyces tuirus TaxID=68278 RepID=A0A941FLW0_9ACTN|nr:hypothetical protein [Streptomyces tuirus]
MAGINRRARAASSALASALLVTLAAGCSHDGPATTDLDRHSHGTAAAPPVGVSGSAHVQAEGVDLTVTHAVAHLDPAGDGTLTMSVRDDDGVPDHLGMVATPDGGRGTLRGGKSDEGAGSMDTAGILLTSGTTVTFGGDGPRVLLRQVRGVTARHTLPVQLQFGVAGLVRLQARVTAR